MSQPTKNAAMSKFTSPTRVLTASQRRNLAEAIGLATGKKWGAGDKLPELSITTLPGLSKMQLAAEIDRLGDIENQITAITKQYESVLDQLEALKKEEKGGLDKLKKIIGTLQEKGKYTAEAKKALLQFSMYLKDAVPGIEQMIMRPEEAKPGAKAGDLFGRIAEKLGKDVADQVEAMYVQCKEDLTILTPTITGLKIVVKTSSIHPAITKAAGLSDVVVGITDWLAGKVNPVAQRILKFVGDIDSWVKGFFVRTKLVEKAKDKLTTALDTAQREMDKVLA